VLKILKVYAILIVENVNLLKPTY